MTRVLIFATRIRSHNWAQLNEHRLRNVSVRLMSWDSFVKIPELASSQRIISRGNIFRLDKNAMVE